MRIGFGWILILAAGLASAGAAPGADGTRLLYRVEEGGDAAEVAGVLEARARRLVGSASAAVEDGRVVVSVPGGVSAERLARLKALLVRPGGFEFRIVALPPNASYGVEGAMETRERARREEKGDGYAGPPVGYRWLPDRMAALPDRLIEIPEDRTDRAIAAFRERLAAAKAPDARALLEHRIADLEAERDRIRREPVFTGADLDPDALGIAPDPQGAGWIVPFAMRPERRAAFADFTGANLKRQMAIVVDGRVESAPTIQSRLSGSSQISGGGMGGFRKTEAEDLANVLASKPLPAPVTLVEED